jgi:hypothetical protein
LGIIAVDASIAGAGAMVVRPAPRRAVRRRFDEPPTLRVTPVTWPVRAEPIAVAASLLDVRVEVAPSAPAGSRAPRGEVAAEAAPESGGDPQTSQYPSTIVPEQPGWVQVMSSLQG